MRHTLIRRFTAETNKLRRKDTDVDDPDERFVPVDDEAFVSSRRMDPQLTHHSTRKKTVQLLGKKILGSLNNP